MGSQRLLGQEVAVWTVVWYDSKFLRGQRAIIYAVLTNKSESRLDCKDGLNTVYTNLAMMGVLGGTYLSPMLLS
jgi:hypothetical protein